MSPAQPAAPADEPETQDRALIRCEHERATLERAGKPIGLVFEAIDRDDA